MFIHPVLDLRIIDGDTVEVTADLGENTTRKRIVRLVGINTPEVTGVEKVAGNAVTDVVRKLTEHPHTWKYMSTVWDKYGGRVLGDFVKNNITLTGVLLEMKIAKAWDGKGSKPGFTPYELEQIAKRCEYFIGGI